MGAGGQPDPLSRGWGVTHAWGMPGTWKGKDESHGPECCLLHMKTVNAWTASPA